ncbi:hypothetical protein BHM03_00016411 [Ensete ventricosum]|nr:hypothetical protein BHM03_00016411 [Ensete ventricosum]
MASPRRHGQFGRRIRPRGPLPRRIQTAHLAQERISKHSSCSLHLRGTSRFATTLCSSCGASQAMPIADRRFLSAASNKMQFLDVLRYALVHGADRICYGQPETTWSPQVLSFCRRRTVAWDRRPPFLLHFDLCTHRSGIIRWGAAVPASNSTELRLDSSAIEHQVGDVTSMIACVDNTQLEGCEAGFWVSAPIHCVGCRKRAPTHARTPGFPLEDSCRRSSTPAALFWTLSVPRRASDLFIPHPPSYGGRQRTSAYMIDSSDSSTRFLIGWRKQVTGETAAAVLLGS